MSKNLIANTFSPLIKIMYMNIMRVRYKSTDIIVYSARYGLAQFWYVLYAIAIAYTVYNIHPHQGRFYLESCEAIGSEPRPPKGISTQDFFFQFARSFTNNILIWMGTFFTFLVFQSIGNWRSGTALREIHERNAVLTFSLIVVYKNKSCIILH